MSGCCDLEEFNVKTLYDKLEDQNLHIASQLARHRKDMQEFYRNICEHTEALKTIFENMDGKKMSLLKELLVHNTMKSSSNSESEGDSPDKACVLLLASVVSSVETLLCKLSGETWKNQVLLRPQDCATAISTTPECEFKADSTRPSDANTPFTRLLMSKGSQIAEKTDHLQSTAPCISDHHLSELVAMSPLFKTLQEIQQSLQAQTINETCRDFQDAPILPPVQADLDGQLTPVALEKLSPQHSAVFLFGCEMMQLLANKPGFPSVLLLLAKSIPFALSSSNESLLAHCSEDYYFDAANQILYLSEAKLQHVGEFVAVLLQSMAHIAAGSKPQRFMQALDEAISALGLQLFNLSFKWSRTQSNSSAIEGERGTLVEQFLNVRVPSEAFFSQQLLASRLDNFKYFKLEQLLSEAKQSSFSDPDTGLQRKGTPVQMSCIEEEIDRLSESFLQLSLQLQRRAQMSMLLQERENSSEVLERSTSMSMPGLSRKGTILLELKRRHVSQRLNELKVTLGLMRQRQQHDSTSEDRAVGRTQSDSTTIQEGEKDYYPGVDESYAASGREEDVTTAGLNVN